MRKPIFQLFLSVIICLAAIVSAALSTFSWAQTIHLRSSPEQIPRSYFGLHIHRIVQTQAWYPNGDKITPWPPIKFGSWRLWDAYVDWPHLEPERGKWNFQTLDKYVASAERAGIELVLPLGLSPAWASARPGEPSNYRPGNAAEPQDIEDWRTYVRQVAQRYKGRIKTYDLWNEVNVKGFYSGSQEKLIELARVAHGTLKEVDPNIVFISPSVVGEGHHRWLDQYLAKGGAKYLDVVGYHFYVPKAGPEAMLPLIQQVQGVMRKHGLQNKPLWNTETGWWISNKTSSARLVGPSPDWRKLDEGHAAAYVGRSLILARAAGVSRFFWFGWDTLDMGLIERGTLELKPAAVAFDTMARSLTGAVLKQCSRAEAIWTCELIRTDHKKVWIVWAEDDAPRNWSIPADWNIEGVERLDASFSKLSGSVVQIGMTPVFLISRDGAPNS
jgi:Glycosyl hydrolases family 39